MLPIGVISHSISSRHKGRLGIPRAFRMGIRASFISCRLGDDIRHFIDCRDFAGGYMKEITTLAVYAIARLFVCFFCGSLDGGGRGEREVTLRKLLHGRVLYARGRER